MDPFFHSPQKPECEICETLARASRALERATHAVDTAPRTWPATVDEACGEVEAAAASANADGFTFVARQLIEIAVDLRRAERLTSGTARHWLLEVQSEWERFRGTHAA